MRRSGEQEREQSCDMERLGKHRERTVQQEWRSGCGLGVLRNIWGMHGVQKGRAAQLPWLIEIPRVARSEWIQDLQNLLSGSHFVLFDILSLSLGGAEEMVSRMSLQYRDLDGKTHWH
jgi:hypothetical protein